MKPLELTGEETYLAICEAMFKKYKRKLSGKTVKIIPDVTNGILTGAHVEFGHDNYFESKETHNAI